MNHATPRVVVHTKLKGAIKLDKHLQLPSGLHPDSSTVRPMVHEFCHFMRPTELFLIQRLVVKALSRVRFAILRVEGRGVTVAALSFPSPHFSGHRMVHFEFGQDR